MYICISMYIYVYVYVYIYIYIYIGPDLSLPQDLGRTASFVPSCSEKRALLV